MAAALHKHLIAPRWPHNAVAFLKDVIAVVDINKARGGFSVAGSAVTRLPEGLIAPNFSSKNIADENALLSAVRQTVEAAGLGNKKRWSIGLPEGVARSLVIGLESKPAGRRELTEIMAWKIERAVAVPASELRVSRQPLASSKDRQRYLATVAREDVISEYDSLFSRLGWHAGLLVPRHLGEAQWLMWDKTPGDKILVSSNSAGFTALIVQDGQPALIRSLECEPQGVLDELYRIVIYYHDHMAGQAEIQAGLSAALILGDIDRRAALDVIVEATGREPHLIDAFQFGMDFSGQPVGFDQLAGAAGLATLASQ